MADRIRCTPARAAGSWFARALIPWLAVVAAAACGVASARADTGRDIAQTPLFLSQGEAPIAVIDLPKDQSLFRAAYNDYSDLDDDGQPETTYVDRIDYYGYFDTAMCYRYGSDAFEPTQSSGGANGHYCSGEWSGNFLNWVSMSRMDILRKILYGGTRASDTASETILERAYIPSDAHAWAKHYDGPDMARLTPFSNLHTQPVVADAVWSDRVEDTGDWRKCGDGDYETGRVFLGRVEGVQVGDPSQFSVGDQIRLEQVTDPDVEFKASICEIDTEYSEDLRVHAPYIRFRLSADEDFDAPGERSGQPYLKWRVTNLSSTGLSMCNVTPARSGLSQNVNGAPLIRVAQGNYALWAANEEWQCRWSEQSNNLQSGFDGGFRSNGNRVALSGLAASAENPGETRNGLGEFKARVKACVPGRVGTQSCKTYPDGNLKPTGLLQRYGDDGGMRFALFTGSYGANFSGGVLRAGARGFDNEVNVDSDGTFTDRAHIVNAIDALRIIGFSYSSGNHYGSGDHCTYQITDPLKSPGEGKCRSWGNPIGEIYLESLRYLAGKSADSAFVPSSSVLGLRIESWEDPLTPQTFCSPLNVLAFNTSVNTFDHDQMDRLSELGAKKSARALTNEIGDHEGITGRRWFVGNTAADDSNICSAKNVTGLGDVLGICPAAPSLAGSYLMAGAAWHARTQRIRSDFKVPAEDTRSLKVQTFGVQLATDVPRIEVPVGARKVTILPAYRLDKPGSRPGTGALVDFKVIERTPTYGRFYVNWEDSNQGGDFDQDVWGILEYRVNGGQITVTTDTIAASTNNPQGFGYTISGTSADGPHFTSGIYRFNYNDPTGVAGCHNCRLEDDPVSVTYSVGDTGTDKLPDPLYFAAKWGGFNDANDNGRPDQPAEWDSTGDGLPDNYFYATNPLGLESALDSALSGVAQTKSSATSAAANSTRLQSDSMVYQATFSSVDWHGDLLAYTLDAATGELANPGAPEWRAASRLGPAASRNILTTVANSGANFTWDALTLEQRLALAQPDPSLTPEVVTAVRDNGAALPAAAVAEGKARLAFIRGERSDEAGSRQYRQRNKDTVLGDIVNSDPVYVGAQDFDYAVSRHVPGRERYAAYVDQKARRTPVLYVGANDGMLHGFSAESGKETMAYVPGAVFPALSALTRVGYSDRHRYLVDGSSRVVDAYIGSAWGTYLIGTTGAGGKSVFALDVTRPERMSAKDVLWEFSTTELSAQGVEITHNTPAPGSNGYEAAQFANLGYSIPAPAAGLLHNGAWAAIVANGYNSDSATASLYIIDLGTGRLLRELDTGFTDGGNGLSTPFPVDVDNDGVFDYVYAGDLRGNLWKFDLTSSNPEDWTIAGPRGRGKHAQPLFVACADAGRCDDTRQPITAAPEVGAYPGAGVMVYFGTGSFFSDADRTDTRAQSFYGIRDRAVTVGNAKAAGTSVQVHRRDLLQQHFLTPADGIVSSGVDERGQPGTGTGSTVRLASSYAIDDTREGWVIDLPLVGERQVSAPILSRGRIIFATQVPSGSPCSAGGISFLVALDAFSGGRLAFSPFDLNRDNRFDGLDKTPHDGDAVYASAIQTSVGIVGTPTLITLSPLQERAVLSGSSGDLENIMINPGPGGGPQAWRQLR